MVLRSGFVLNSGHRRSNGVLCSTHVRIKRGVALPGDDVFVAERVVVVNRQALEEPEARCPRSNTFPEYGRQLRVHE